MFTRVAHHVVGCAFAMVFLGLGCERQVDTDAPSPTRPTPPPTPVNVSALLDSASVTLTWEVVDTTAVRRFRIYSTDSANNVTRLRDSTTGVVFSKTVSGLKVNQAYAFEIATVGPGGIEGYHSEPLVIRMQVLGVTIDNGAEYTRDRDVVVQFAAPSGTTNVLLAEDQAFAGASWQSYSPSKNLRLSMGDGPKRVYARFLMSGGLETAPVTDSITLDSRAFIDSVYFTPTSGTIQAGTVMHFFVHTGEPGGEAAISFTADSLRLFDDGTNGDATPADGLYSYRYVVPFNVGAEASQVTGLFTDPAGNRAPRKVASRLLTILNDPPDPVVLAATAATDSVRLSWSSSLINDFQAYRLYRQEGNGTVDENDQLIAVINQQNTTQFADVVSGAGTWLYRIFVVDDNDQSIGSNTVTVVK